MRSAGKTNKKDDATVLTEPQMMSGIQVELSSSPPSDFMLLSKDVLYSTEAGVLFVGSCDQPTSSRQVIEPENHVKARKKLQVTPEIMVSSTDGKIGNLNFKIHITHKIIEKI